jgi:hypothetical protein
MRCLRAHSSTLWGSPVDGDVFDVHDGYVAQIEAAGLAERVDAPEAPADAPEAPADAPEAPDEGDDLDAAIASLQAGPITGDNLNTGRGRRGRRK